MYLRTYTGRENRFPCVDFDRLLVDLHHRREECSEAGHNRLFMSFVLVYGELGNRFLLSVDRWIALQKHFAVQVCLN